MKRWSTDAGLPLLSSLLFAWLGFLMRERFVVGVRQEVGGTEQKIISKHMKARDRTRTNATTAGSSSSSSSSGVATVPKSAHAFSTKPK
jgi:hypothetical protein